MESPSLAVFLFHIICPKFFAQKFGSYVKSRFDNPGAIAHVAVDLQCYSSHCKVSIEHNEHTWTDCDLLRKFLSL